MDREREVINTEVICKGRGQGKTYDLVMESARTGYPIITPNRTDYILDLARRIGVSIPEPMSMKQFETYKNNGSLMNSRNWKGKVLVDEFDYILESLLGIKVGTVTCTPDSLDYRREYMGEWIGGRGMSTKSYKDLLFDAPKFIMDKEYFDKMIINPSEIKDINIIVPNKVVEVTFADNHKEKMICHQDDEFSLRRCLFIAIAKRKYKKSYTVEGIEFKATELSMLKECVKIVDKALKAYEKKQKDLVRLEENRKTDLERAEKRRIKKAERDLKRSNAFKEEMIEMQKEAYIRAMDEIESRKTVAVK